MRAPTPTFYPNTRSSDLGVWQDRSSGWDVVTRGLESVAIGHIVDFVGLSVGADVAEESLDAQHGQLLVDAQHGASLLTGLSITGLVAKRVVRTKLTQVHSNVE